MSNKKREKAREKTVSKFSKQFLNHISSINNKRAKILINHIMKRGFITTEELEKKYGYNHPPRAARDVREAGVPLITFKIKSQKGKSIAAYRFGDLHHLNIHRLKGRIQVPKKIKQQLFSLAQGKCAICNGIFEERYLQVDHRIPYQVAGDIKSEVSLDDYMLLCGSCNRAKSWSCEHCENWLKDKNAQLCLKCYWGNPNNYSHIAKQEMRRLDLLWRNAEVKSYDAIKILAKENNLELPDFVKDLIAKKVDSIQ